MSRSRTALVLLALLGCPGCPAPAPTANGPAVGAVDPDKLPTEPDKLLSVADAEYEKGGAGVQNSIAALRRAIDKNPEWARQEGGYGAFWRLARGYADLANGQEKDQKEASAQTGIEAGKRAMELGKGKVEGPYYLAQLYGYLAQARGGETRELISQMQARAEQADKIDPAFDHAGPARVLGALHAKAPAPPVSVGDPDKAVQLLQRAVQLDGSFPANTIYLAEALVADERYPEAEAAVKSARALMQGPKRWQRYHDKWSAELERVEKKLRARQG